MSPLGMVPPARAGMPRSVAPPRMPAPRAQVPAPRVQVRPPTVTPTQTALDSFRTALAQLKASTPSVDQNAIYQPYRASEAVAGQLGQGLQQSVLAGGQAAQDQYAKAQTAAQQQAAQFGISAGGSTAGTAVQNAGAAPLAAQTNAYAAAAPQSTAAWQGLLERSAAAKLSAAQLARAQGLTSAEQALSATIPSAIQAEKQRAFQQQTQKFNQGLALTQLDAKQKQFAQNYGLGVAKVQQAGSIADTNAQIKRQALAEKTANDKARLAQGAQNIAIRARAKAATAKGLQGIPAALKALQGGTTSGSTKTVTGYNVSIAPGPNSVDAGAPARTLFAKDPTKIAIPSGWVRSGDPKPVTGPTTTTKTTTSITPAQWDIQMRALIAANPPGSTPAIKQFLGPRPKK